MNALRFTIAMLVYSLAAFAQQPGDFSSQPPRGDVKLIVDVIASPSSMEDMVRISHAIVYGSVTSNTAIRHFGRGMARSPLVATETVIAVDRILKGELPAKPRQLLLSEIGGRTESGVVEAVNDRLIAEGERYVLFLQKDERQTDRADVAHLPAYAVTGVWSGKARVTDSGIEFPPGAAQGLRKFNGMSLDEFVAAVKAAQDPPPSTERLPIHPGGGRQRKSCSTRPFSPLVRQTGRSVLLGVLTLQWPDPDVAVTGRGVVVLQDQRRFGAVDFERPVYAVGHLADKFLMVVDHHAVVDHGDRGRLHHLRAFPFRSFEEDVVALPLARRERGVGARRELAIHGRGLAVGVSHVVERLHHLDFVAAHEYDA